MSKGYFITGTDTEIGKTTIAVGLIQALRNAGNSVSAMKPIASGCDTINGELRNDDALKLIKACDRNLEYSDVNPYAFAPPIAPHIAAEQAGVKIDISTICNLAETHKANNDYTIIEGVGGWHVPLNEKETVEDLAIALKLPTILVVGLRLGCINHALLTANAIQNSGLILAGWVANNCDLDTKNGSAITNCLEKRISSPCIAKIGHLSNQHTVPYHHEFNLGTITQE